MFARLCIGSGYYKNESLIENESIRLFILKTCSQIVPEDNICFDFIANLSLTINFFFTNFHLAYNFRLIILLYQNISPILRNILSL